MDAKGWMMLSALVNRYHTDNAAAILQYLPEEERDQTEHYPIDDTGADVTSLFYRPEKYLTTIHYSWLVPVIQNFSKELQPFILSALPTGVFTKINKCLDKPCEPLLLAPTVKRFFNQLVYESILEKEILPTPFIPKSNLSPLLSFNKKKLLQVIDFLGLNDLAAEIPRIIDQKLIKTLYTQLSPKKREYLKLSLEQRLPPNPAPLPLAGINANGRHLSQLLHRKGLVRLGTALKGHDSSFLWHITHTLDVGRAKILTKYLSEEDTTAVAGSAASQLIHVIDFLRT